MWALLSLAIGSFGIGMTEFVVMGLLPQISADLLPALSAADPDTAIAHTGWLISLYALGVVVGAPTIAASVAKYPRHRVMLVLAAALTLFNALTFVMPTFELVAVSRFLAGLPHGAYFGIGALVASDVLGPGKRAQGVAFVLTGLTLANVVGVPVGTGLGQQFGWRVAFMIVAAIFALAAILIAFFVPAHAGDPGRTLRAELGVFRIPQVWLTLAVGAIGFGGFFAAYSYIASIVTEVAGSPAWAVPIVLVVIGVGMTVGNLLGGRLADRDLRRTLLGGSRVARARAGAPRADERLDRQPRGVRLRRRRRLVGAEPVDPDAAHGCRGRQPVHRRGPQPLRAQHRQRDRGGPRRRGDRGGARLRRPGVGGRRTRRRGARDRGLELPRRRATESGTRARSLLARMPVSGA